MPLVIRALPAPAGKIDELITEINEGNILVSARDFEI